jgi:hypothetical protein
MRPTTILLSLISCLAPLPVLASSCAEQIGTIERRLDSPGAIQVAGLQDGHSIRTGTPRGVDTAWLDAPSDLVVVSTAGRVEVARTLIVRAAEEDRQGKKRACENTMSEAKGMIGALL